MRAGGVQLLAPLLRGASGATPNQQLLYDAGLAAWQLTFYQPAAQIMGTTGEPYVLIPKPWSLRSWAPPMNPKS